MNAQNLSVGAGYLNSTLTNKVGNNSTSSAYQGFYAGANAAVVNDGAFAITPGLFLEYLTNNNAADFYGLVGAETTATEMYLNVPVDFSYGIALGSAKLSIFAGPTFSFGLLSNYKSNASVLGGKTNDVNTDNYGDKSSYGRFDILVGGGLALDFANCFRISAGYNYGLLDRNSTDAIKCNRSEIHAGVAYLF